MEEIQASIFDEIFITSLFSSLNIVQRRRRRASDRQSKGDQSKQIDHR